MSIKRNTTPTIDITINLPFENVQKIEFIFKEKNNKDAPILLYKTFSKDTLNLKEGDKSKKFTVLVDLTCEDTLKLPAGKIYVDSRVTLTNGKVPNTKITSSYVSETFFEEVHK